MGDFLEHEEEERLEKEIRSFQSKSLNISFLFLAGEEVEQFQQRTSTCE